ncbi:hypothetical protein J3B02_002087 [Coemansia erecta]|uniref:Uncharacterized protein n=1 Tax=Coemansia asiatica TaxID=1052880 RepID=A0A9W7XLP1_9FUNG|nr:hypothetical protein LPJ64_003078 [Coemansia asiatica]KAJ2855575.1 hypothetical protein J3B02_002087 [Coemansia erecta]KAJ2885377.1 hypothetical protein FB639_001785 [Coemansia asiatica]
MAATAASPPQSGDIKSADPAIYEDSRSETSTVDTESEDLSNLTFFTRLYELPIVSDAVNSIYRIAESNKYSRYIISYAEKAGGYAEKSRPLLKPVEKPLSVIDGYATRSLEIIEAKYPIVAKPTTEVIESVQSRAKAVESKYPLVARTFAVAKSTANSALDRVDYLVDYVLPAKDTSQSTSDADADADANADPETKTGADNQAQTDGANAPACSSASVTSDADSPLEKITILVHKVPQRVGKAYYDQLLASKTTIGGIKQSVKDTVNVYESEISERSSRLLDSVQERVKTAVNTTIPGLLPQFAKPYYVQSKDILAAKASKLHAEYSRTDEDMRSKVLNLILISGEQVPVLEKITSRIFGKAMGADAEAAPASESADATAPVTSMDTSGKSSVKGSDADEDDKVSGNDNDNERDDDGADLSVTTSSAS